MKTFLNVLLIAISITSLISCKTGTGSQASKSEIPPNDSTLTVIALNHLLETCWKLASTENFAAADELIVYRGEDRERKWKVVCNYEMEEEKKLVDQACRRVIGRLEKGNSFRITEYISERESEGVWHVLKVEHQEKQTYFAFLKIDGKMALGDMDN